MIAQAEKEDRNEWGLPLQPIEVTAHERSHQTTKVDVDQSRGKNELLPWFVMLAIVAAAGMGLAVGSLSRITDLNTRLSDQQRTYEARIADLQRADEGRITDLRDKYAETKQQADLLTYYVMEFDGKMMQRKVITPAESFSGQQLQRARAQQKQEQRK